MRRTAVVVALAAASVAAGAPIAIPALEDRTDDRAHAAVHAVTVTTDESARRVDVAIDGAPFTSYIWPERLKKPVLYPLRAASGTVVTRGWPLDPRPGERVDHPHHVGLWLNYGNVNGVDFWNNSDAVKPSEAAAMGTIVHRRIVEAASGAAGRLVTESDWIGPASVTLLREHTEYVFSGDAVARTVDRVTTLTAAGRRVVFNDNKEGVFGLRVARALEHPSSTPETFTDASGRATGVPVLDNTGVTGQYTTSEGTVGDQVWGTRGRWTMLTGRIASRPVTIAIIDHPRNPGFPTYWHARGYGLFAANPLGTAALSEGRQAPTNLVLEAGRSITFRYRLIIVDGTAARDRIEREFAAFSAGQTSSR